MQTRPDFGGSRGREPQASHNGTFSHELFNYHMRPYLDHFVGRRPGEDTEFSELTLVYCCIYNSISMNRMTLSDDGICYIAVCLKALLMSLMSLQYNPYVKITQTGIHMKAIKS